MIILHNLLGLKIGKVFKRGGNPVLKSFKKESFGYVHQNERTRVSIRRRRVCILKRLSTYYCGTWEDIAVY
jgi:hypothetical protein